MLRKDVDALGPAAFSAKVKPLAEFPRESSEYLGWDTEYDSVTGKLVCYQLWGANGGKLYTHKMTIDSLARSARELGILGPKVFLVSFFSIAEMQFLPVVEESYNWRLYGSGSFDATFYSDRYSLEIATFDVARFFDRQKLASVAESFGLKKLDFDTTRVTRRSLKTKSFTRYALHDAFLCHAILEKLRENLGGADPLVHKTAPGCAAALFRVHYLKEDLLPPEPRYRLMAMLGCWGGRSEAYSRGSFRELFEYDLNSAYPNAAISLVSLPDNRAWRSLDTMHALENTRKCCGGFARVRFQFPDGELYPCLPVLIKGVLLYPLRGETFCTVAEIRLAVKIGASVKLVEGYGYRGGRTELAEYMRTILAERSKATGARRVALKLLANSLIGKLAQRVEGIDVEALRKLALETGVSIAKLARLTIHEAKALGVNADPRIGAVFYPDWNGLITGFVRAQISEMARLHSAVYCATDAIWTRKRITRVPASYTLKRHGPGVVARTRLGFIDEGTSVHLAHHGIWKRDVAERLLRGDLDAEILYQVERPNKLKESLKNEKQYGKWETYERYATAGWDQKRRLRGDGSSEPWVDASEYEEAKTQWERDKRRQTKNRGGKKC